VIATKFGIKIIIEKQVQEKSYEEIRKSIEDSLKRLQTDYIICIFRIVFIPTVPIENATRIGIFHNEVNKALVRHTSCCH